MNGNPAIGMTLLLVTLAWLAVPLHANQQSAPTVRHHRVEEQSEDPAAADIEQAEAAMQKQDYAAAETLLKKALTANPQSYQAWFDLGYVYNQTKRTADATNAYRKSIAAKLDVFESNLNLGILLARQGDSAEA